MAYSGEGGIQDIRARIYRERGSVVLDASGDATIVFDNPFPSSSGPFLLLTPRVGVGENPVIANPISTSWVTNGDGDYISVDIHGERTQNLPNPLISLAPLVGRRVSVASDASGVTVDWMLY